MNYWASKFSFLSIHHNWCWCTERIIIADILCVDSRSIAEKWEVKLFSNVITRSTSANEYQKTLSRSFREPIRNHNAWKLIVCTYKITVTIHGINFDISTFSTHLLNNPSIVHSIIKQHFPDIRALEPDQNTAMETIYRSPNPT